MAGHSGGILLPLILRKLSKFSQHLIKIRIFAPIQNFVFNVQFGRSSSEAAWPVVSLANAGGHKHIAVNMQP